jgi:acetyl esterase/lipase
MKKLFLLAITLFLTACTDSALLVVNTLAKFDNYTLSKDHAYGSHPLQKLDVYKPKAEAKGIIIFFYGGCWGACTTYSKKHYTFVAQALTSKGYIVVIPDYRLYPEVLFPKVMEDAVSVVQWTKQNLTSKKNKLFLMGHSAGGHIAAMLTVNKSYLGDTLSKDISGFIGLSAPYDFIFNEAYLPKLFANIDYKNTQPSTFVEGDEAPLLLLYGKDDTKVYMRNIVNMTKKVKAKNGKVETHIYKGINHVDILTALSIPLRGKSDVMRDIERFLLKCGE